MYADYFQNPVTLQMLLCKYYKHLQEVYTHLLVLLFFKSFSFYGMLMLHHIYRILYRTEMRQSQGFTSLLCFDHIADKRKKDKLFFLHVSCKVLRRLIKQLTNFKSSGCLSPCTLQSLSKMPVKPVFFFYIAVMCFST